MGEAVNSVTREQRQIRLEPELWQRLDTEATDRALSLNKMITITIEAGLDAIPPVPAT